MESLDLFAALKRGAADAEVLAAIAASPGAAKEKNEEKMLPLHYAIASGTSEAVVAALLRAYPEAAKEKGLGGMLPLHCAIDRQETDWIKATEVEGESKEAGAKVIYEGREMVVSRGVDNDGDLKLKPVVNEDVILALLYAYPEAAKEKDNCERLPLHCAVSSGASEAVVAALQQTYPEAAKEKDNCEKLPLHCAVSSGASEAVVAALQQTYPEAAKEKDHRERLPLHCAVSSGASEAVVAALQQAHPEAAKEKDEDGRLPLHWAVSSGASEAVVAALQQAYPEAAKEKDNRERLPLHCGLEDSASEEVVLALLHAYPEAAKEKDTYEKLPLHCAVSSGASEAVVAALQQTYPEAAKEKDTYERLPLHCGLEDSASEEVVLALLHAYPEAAKEKDTCERLPLHCAVLYGASEAVVAALQQAYPEAAKEKDNRERLPLHCAVSSGASEAVVAALQQTYPEAAKEKDNCERLPLHCAVSSGASEAVVAALQQTYPEAAKEKDNCEKLPLHCAVSSGASEAVVAALQQTYPEAAKEKDNRERLPLHCAVSSGASEAVVAALQQAHPEAAKEKDEDGRLPLHWAVASGASEAVVAALQQTYPEAAKEKDNRERLPLHCAVLEGASEAVVAALQQAHPEAAKEKDENGRLPLHWAVASGASEAVVAALQQTYPEAAKEKDKDERLPLHCAVLYGASEAVVLALLQAHPEAAKEKDEDGRLPLHCAVLTGASEAVVLALLHAYPEAAKEKDKRGGLPLHCAVLHGASEEVVAALLAAGMPLRLDTGAPADHAGSWPYAVASTDERVIAAVGRVLASKSDDPPGHGFGAHIHALVKVRDEEGRTALEASTAGPREAIYLHLLFCGRYELVIGAPEHRSATSVVLRARDLGEKTDYGKVFDDADKDKSGTLDRKELAPVAASIGLDVELFLRTEQDKSIDRSSFVGICKQQLGDGQRSVVIKLMQETDQWERERDARAKNQLDSRFVVQQLPGVPSDDEIAAAVRARGGGLGAIAEQYLPKGISLGTRAIIMDAADRNLHQIFLQERPDLNGVRAILQQVFEAVAHLHEKGLMHGDLKLLNVVRFRRDNRLRLIDLDAAAKIVPVGGEGESYAGAKFSSGVLPPEMFHELKQGEAEALKSYWQGESKELQAKVAPKSFSERGVVKSIYAVKSFRTARGGEPIFDGLPYSEELVKASEKVDAWSLGVLAFVLLAGEPLVPSTRDDDCASGAAMRMLHGWGTQPGVVLERLEKVDDPAARDIVDKLLQREPSARPPVAALLKEHPFFHFKSGDAEMNKKLQVIMTNQATQTEMLARIAANVDIIKELSIENKHELRRTREVLLKGYFEASEATTPTTIVVLLKKLPVPPDEEEKAKLLEIAADGSGVTLGNDNFSVAFSGEMAVAGGEYVDTLNTGMTWLRRLKTIGSDLAGGMVGDAFETIKAGLDDLVTGETMYLYLVDELTGEPVRDPSGHYPIEIKTPSDVVPKLLPVMQVGLRAMSVFNGAAGVARMFGYPIPTVPEAWATGARESVALLKQESSMEQFSVVHEEVVKDRDAKEITSKEQKSVRGASLRELQRFFEVHDVKKGYAGLRRIADEDGTAVWTALTDSSAVKAAIEARAKERREEERRGDELLKQALSSSAAGPACRREAEELRSQDPVAAAATAAAKPAALTTAATAVTATWPWSFFFGPTAVAAAPTATETLPSAPAPVPVPVAAAAAGASSGGQQMAHAVVSTAGAVEEAVAEVAAAAKAAVASVAAELAAKQQQQQQRLDSHEKQLSELQTQKKEPPQLHTERREEEQWRDELSQQALELSSSAPAATAAAGASSGEQQMPHAVVSTAGAVEVAAAAAAAAAAKAAVASVAAELSELRNQEKEPQQQQQQRLDSLEKQLAELQIQLRQPKRSRFSLVSRKGPVTK